MEPLEFMYRVGRGVDDAKTLLMGTVHKHPEHPNTPVRLLFADFSSAFNTLRLHILAEKLSNQFGMDNQLIPSTGSPQGCVFSPLLFIL